METGQSRTGGAGLGCAAEVLKRFNEGLQMKKKAVQKHTVRIFPAIQATDLFILFNFLTFSVSFLAKALVLIIVHRLNVKKPGSDFCTSNPPSPTTTTLKPRTFQFNVLLFFLLFYS